MMEGGESIHPPHRFGDRMIDVRLAAGDRVGFFEGGLSLGLGPLRILPGNPAGHEALYVLEDARTEPANKPIFQSTSDRTAMDSRTRRS